MCPCKSWKLKKLVFWVRASSALFELNCPRINYIFYKLAWPSDWRRVVTRAYSFLCTGKDRFYISVCRLRPIKIFSRKSGTEKRPRFFFDIYYLETLVHTDTQKEIHSSTQLVGFLVRLQVYIRKKKCAPKEMSFTMITKPTKTLRGSNLPRAPRYRIKLCPY